MDYPDRQLIERLHAQYSGCGIETMTQTEILDLINHTTELSRDQEKEIVELRAENAKLIKSVRAAPADIDRMWKRLWGEWTHKDVREMWEVAEYDTYDLLQIHFLINGR